VVPSWEAALPDGILTRLNGARHTAGTYLAPGVWLFDLEEALVISSVEETVEIEETDNAFEPPVPSSMATEDELTHMVKEYMPLVRHAVNRIVAGSSQSTILGYEDMVSCGVQGLLEAHRTYDPDRGAKFSTYALPRIRGSILDALRAAHPLPRSLQKVSSDIEKAVTSLYGDLGRTPTKSEIAERMGLTLGELLTVSQSASIKVLSLESLADMTVNGATEKLTEMADDDPGVDPHTVAQRGLLRGQLLDAIDDLPDREREIIRLYYIESRSLKSIGRAMAISESRASQLRHRAIRRLRTALNSDLVEAA
jgi:RNA polymerase sigma factor for flagellar operon FliA